MEALTELYRNWNDAITDLLDKQRPYRTRLAALRYIDSILGETTPPDQLEQIADDLRKCFS